MTETAPLPLDDLRTFTPEQVVELFLPAMTPRGLRNLAQKGRIRHRRMGANRQIVFTAGDIREFLASCEVPPRDEQEEAAPVARRRSSARRGSTQARPAVQAGLTARPGGPRRLAAVQAQ